MIFESDRLNRKTRKKTPSIKFIQNPRFHCTFISGLAGGNDGIFEIGPGLGHKLSGVELS